MGEKKRTPQPEEKGKTVPIISNSFTRAESYLSNKYDFRKNIVSHQYQYKAKDQQKYNDLNEHSLFRELQKVGIIISLNNLVALIKSDFVPEYDPFTEYFENLKWDGKDHISELSFYVKAREQTEWKKHFKKHLVRTVACALIPEYFNKQALIIIDPKQNSGKSTFIRFLCPPFLSDYIAEDLTTDKDSRILLAKNLIINLDELAVLSKKDVTQLKSFISKDKINDRLPFDRRNSILPRRASFFGSSNNLEILNDETGSVRWICFEITSIDWSYREKIKIDQVWAQSYALFKDSGFNYQLTKEEIIQNEKRNENFQKNTVEMELIQKLFVPDEDKHPENFKTATEILSKISDLSSSRIHLSRENVGKAMTKLGYPKGRNTLSMYGYFIKQTLCRNE